MQKGWTLACVLAATVVSAADDSEDMEIFIQHSDENGASEPMEIFIEHSDDGEPAAQAPRGEKSKQQKRRSLELELDFGEDGEEPLPAVEKPPLEVRAWSTGARAFVAVGPDPTSEHFVDGLGQIELRGEDRARERLSTAGDLAQLEAKLRVGVDTWRIQLATVGEPEDATWRFGFPVEGGVRVGTLVLGNTGVPFRGGAPAVSAFAVFGTARVEHNGRQVADAAPVELIVLSTGIHADDDTHRRLPVAREEDAELIVFLPELAAAPNGFLLVTYEDVEVSLGMQRLHSTAYIPTVPALNPEALSAYTLGHGKVFPEIPPPRFDGFNRSPAANDSFPLPPHRVMQTPSPLNGAPATNLALGINVQESGIEPITGGAFRPVQPAEGFAQGIAPVNTLGLPQGARVLHGGAPVLGTAPADPLIAGIAPLNSQPLPIADPALPVVTEGRAVPIPPGSAQTFRPVPTPAPGVPGS